MISWVNSQKYENLLQFNTSWLISLRSWYYFRLCFSFSCSGHDLTLIKKSQAVNYYSFLQKFLLKSKTYKLVVGNLVTVIAQSTTKTTNSEKAFYFLSLMSCAINKPKSRMFFTCKNFMFSNFNWKKFFAPGNQKSWGGGGWRPLPPFLWGPVIKNKNS